MWGEKKKKAVVEDCSESDPLKRYIILEQKEKCRREREKYNPL